MTRYPFTAVVGQDLFKLALLLNAIDPQIGGVLVSGPRGCAKSTLARAIAELLPQGAFVNLPLGTTEEMLCGTLDLQQALGQQHVAFQPGLLSKANGGVLYIDEVNLLSDRLVDLLLDVAASGVNYIERDSISHQHACRFMLLGTMNPDEGEVRDQLKDRFGLSVMLENEKEIDARVLIAQRRADYEQNPQGFISQFAETQQHLQQQVNKAQQALLHVTIETEALRDIAARCIEAGVEGMRADIVWSRAAKAHAALQGRTHVDAADVSATESLVLAHRRTHSVPETPPQAQTPSKRPPESLRDDTHMPPSEQGDWGAMPPVEHQKIAPAMQSVQPTSVETTCTAAQINWAATLTGGATQPVRREQVNVKEKLNLILLDTSGSTLTTAQGHDLLAYARDFVTKISKNAYLQRQRLTVFGFGNDAVELLTQQRRAPKAIEALWDSLTAGGGTPLAEVLITARDYLAQQCLRDPQLQVETFLLTDGHFQDIPDSRPLPGTMQLLDLEQGELRLGKAKQLAQRLNAHYIPLF